MLLVNSLYVIKVLQF